MSLTVEDGTVVSGADSYVTLSAYQAYGAALGWALGDTDAADEINLRRAFQTVNRQWSYLGVKADEGQAGEFPRYIAESNTNSDEIPQEVMDAQCELAFLIQGGLDPFATVSGVVASTKAKAGPVETETTYLGGLSTSRIVAVEGLLRPYLASGRGQVVLRRA